MALPSSLFRYNSVSMEKLVLISLSPNANNKKKTIIAIDVFDFFKCSVILFLFFVNFSFPFFLCRLLIFVLLVFEFHLFCRFDYVLI